jgi:acetate kinase
MTANALFVLNSGSSSLKFGVFAERDGEVRASHRGAVEGIGAEQGKVWLRNGPGNSVWEQKRAIPNQKDAARVVAQKLSEMAVPKLDGIGHRLVHGGPSLTAHQKITPEVVQQLEAAAHFAPLHVPVALELIRETQQLFPDVAQFACFDTAFHRTLPEAAARLPLPEKFWEAGIRKYGFHGLSCESIVHALGPLLPPRVIVAHLGNGASLTAIAKGLSVDTSMGLTPTGGIIMGTRPGDLDPGVLLHILRGNGNNVEELERLLNKESGLLGVSGASPDMRTLHEAAQNNPQARLAIEMFARSARKAVGSYVAILGGLDLLVFAGGIGEHDAAVRSLICEELDCLGVRLDPEANRNGAATISAAGSLARVQVVASDEETQMARIVFGLLDNAALTKKDTRGRAL